MLTSPCMQVKYQVSAFKLKSLKNYGIISKQEVAKQLKLLVLVLKVPIQSSFDPFSNIPIGLYS